MQLSQLQESRGWLMAAVPAQADAPSAAGMFPGQAAVPARDGNGRWEMLPYFCDYKQFPQVFFGDKVLGMCNWDNVKGGNCGEEEQVPNLCEGRAVR